MDMYAGDKPLTITFRSRVLPGASTMIKGIEIKMVKTFADLDYVVDEIVDDDLEFFRPEA